MLFRSATMNPQSGNGFSYAMDFGHTHYGPAEYTALSEDNTQNAFFFGDEGIDTATSNSFGPSFDSRMYHPLTGVGSGVSMPKDLVRPILFGPCHKGN